jgi:serine/threonine-protein kinase RsbW
MRFTSRPRAAWLLPASRLGVLLSQSTMGSEMSPYAFRGSARENSGVPGHHRHRSHRSGGWARPAGTASDVRLSVPARPEYIGVIRHVLGAFAEALGLPPGQVEDMRLAVTEACTNVVRHAYHDHEPGPMDVVIRPGGDRVELIVSDEGRGMGPSPDVAGPGLGLPLIAALADSVDVGREPSRGSRLAMSFHCRPRLGAA